MTDMTFDKIKKAVGKNIKIYSDAGDWLTGRDITEDDIGEFVNQLYRDDLFPLFATQYPEDYREDATANSWIANGTADAGLTGSTLVMTTSIFTNDMVGLYAYNDTASEKSKITAYTSGTTVTVEDTDIADWSGDSIYVLGSEFVLGGNATNIHVLETVNVKYTSSDDNYRNCGMLRHKPDIFQSGSEVGSQASPYAYVTTKLVSGVPKSAVGILPGFDAKVSNAVKISYIARPAELSGDNDVPRIPVALALVEGATAKARRSQGDHKDAGQWDAKYEKSKIEAISRYSPNATAYPQEFILPRKARNIFNRLY